MSQERDYIVWVRCSAEVPYVVKASSEAEARTELEEMIQNGDLGSARQISDSYIQWDGPDDEPDERTVTLYTDYFNSAPERR